jgi:tetratricopeptide (TPR) repeat protein
MDKLETAKELFLEGVRLLQNNQFDEAEKKFLDSLKIIPDKESVLNNLSVVQIATKKYKEARENTNKAIALNDKSSVAWQNLGIINMDEGQHQNAIQCFTRSIQFNSEFAEPWSNQAISLAAIFKYNEALICCDNAIDIKNNFFEAYNNKGDILRKLNRNEEALKCYEQSILINTDSSNAPAYTKKGDLLCDLERYDEGISSYDLAIKIRKNFIEAHCNKILALNKIKKYTEALDACNEALKINDKLAELWVNKALVLINMEKFKEALEASNLAILINENLREAWNNKGLAEQNLELYEEGIKSFQKGIELSPNSYESWHNKGVCYFWLKEFDKALECADQTIRINKNFAPGWMAKAAALTRIDKLEEALINFETALQKNPNEVAGIANYGLCQHQMGLVTKDMAWFEKAKNTYNLGIKLDPKFYENFFNKSLTELTLGEYKEGWENYEYRLKIKKAENQSPFNTLPILKAKNIEDLKDRKVIIWSEQGLGDSIQFSRFVFSMIETGAKVIFQVPGPVVNLLSKNLKCKVISKGETIIDYIDFQIPLASLPWLFKTTMDNIPLKKGYLKSSSIKDNEWKNKLKLSNTKLNIGIAFSGNKEYVGDKYRSTTLSSFEPLLNKGKLFLLQKDIKPEDEIFLKAHPEIEFVGKNIDDFYDLASVVQNMDLVVSTDTSIPHLSSALGKKTFMLLSAIADWRWLINTDYSPWYSTLKIFRKKEAVGSWKDIFDEVIKALPAKI